MTDKKKEKPKHLGRGLESLIGPIISMPTDANHPMPDLSIESNFPPDKELRSSLREISIDSISPNPYQARTVWNDQELAQLAESIKANGIIQPIIVRPVGPAYQLIAGERRFRAARLASLTTIPAIIRQATDEELLELATSLVNINNGKLQNYKWLEDNHPNLINCMMKHPNLFVHFERETMLNTPDENLEIAKKLSKENNGILQCHKWLNKNKYSKISAAIYNHPEIFKGIRMEMYKGRTKFVITIGEESNAT